MIVSEFSDRLKQHPEMVRDLQSNRFVVLIISSGLISFSLSMGSLIQITITTGNISF
jgi:hypothetical protein